MSIPCKDIEGVMLPTKGWHASSAYQKTEKGGLNLIPFSNHESLDDAKRVADQLTDKVKVSGEEAFIGFVIDDEGTTVYESEPPLI